MAEFFERLLTKKSASANTAKERLKFVLINDRTNLTPKEMDSLKNDIIAVISRYVEINPAEVEISFNQDGREQRLVADIPIKKASQRRIG